jgi:ABC-type nitrate/sulfonate/bicarbonate transport system substrate-binding protein
MERVTLFLLAVFLLAVVPSRAKADDLIRIGIIANTFGYAPVFVGKEKGFFKREGLYPEIIIISRNEQIVQALISDSLQFGNVPPNLLFVLRQQGNRDIKLIAGSFLFADRVTEVQKNGRPQRRHALGDVGHHLGGRIDDEANAQGARRDLSARL